MAKDPMRNIDRYKIRGSHLNEFDFRKHQAEMAEEFEPPAGDGSPQANPRTRAERVAQVIAAAKRKVAKKKKHEAAKTNGRQKPVLASTGKSPTIRTASKRAASKASKKKTPAKTTRSPTGRKK